MDYITRKEEGTIMENVHKIKITLNGKEWTDILDETFKKKNKEVTIEGFRKGHAPKDIFLKKFGIEYLYTDAVDKALPTAYTKAIEEKKLTPECEPAVDVLGIDTEHVEFEFTIITRPEVKLSKYKGLGVKKETPKVTKKEIEEEINSLRNRFAEIVVKDSGVVEKGNIAIIDFKGFVDDKAFDGGEGTDFSLEIGSNTFIPGFEDGLIGAKKGESLDVKVTFPEDYTPELKGKDAVFKVTVKEIKARILPELNEEFYQDLGFDDVKTEAEFENKVEEHLMEHKNADAENKYIDDLIDAGIKNMTVEINDEIVNEEVNRMVRDLAHRFESQGIPLNSYLEFTGTTMEQLREQAKGEAVRRIKSRYLLDKIIEEEKIDATDEEVHAHAKEQAGNHDMDEADIIKAFGGMDVVKYDLLIHKAINVLKGE